MPDKDSMDLKPESTALQKDAGAVSAEPAGALQAERSPNSLAWAKEAMQIDIAQSARKRRVDFLLRILLWVGLPTVLAALYVYVYATPRYVSEFQLTYQTYSQPGSSSSALGGGGSSSSLLSSVLGIGSSSVDMSRVIASYLTSNDLVEHVDAKINLREQYGNSHIDWLDRLPSNASQEQLLAYFQKRITVEAIMGGYVIVDVEAFDRDTTKKIAQAMAASADEMVQAISDRALLDQVQLAQKELTRTQGLLLKATLDVTNFRNAHHNFDPQAAAIQLGTVVGGLESQLSSYRATLASLRTFVSDDAPAVKALRAQIDATEKEMVSENYRLATAAKSSADHSAGTSEPYSQTVADFVYLTAEQQFATDTYTSAKAALDAARTMAANKRAYVESFVAPNKPEESTEPGLKTVFGTFLAAMVVYMIGSLLVAALRDDAGV
jgi:capsular polysaccharide transport system permease protein